MPLLKQGQLSGILYLENRLTPDAFPADRLEILNLLSAQAAISLENAKLLAEQVSFSALQRELNIAQDIQQSLLPPVSPDWTALEVGGDLYTYRQLTPNQFVVSVGDVSGKGMPAALLMAVSLASLQSMLAQGLPPSDLLTQLDGVIKPYTKTTRQNCAMVVAQISLDPHGGGHQLEVANAGCITPLVKRADGSVSWVEVGGLPLGIDLSLGLGYQQSKVALSYGDLLILTSDGVVEANDAANQMLGFDQLEAIVAQGPTDSAAAMIAHLQQAINAFVGSAEPHDDLTMVVVKVV